MAAPTRSAAAGGNDTLIGGDGNDVYNVESGDVIVEYAGGGVDQVVSATFADLAGLAVENLLITGSASVVAIGNELANKITANAGITSLFGQAGNDTLIGGGGNNGLDGGAGADVMVGGDGSDTYFVDDIGDKVGETGTKDSALDEVRSSVSYILGANVERLTLTGAGDLSGTGNALANTINGNAGNNAIDGAAGNDSMFGDFGNDLLLGGAGDDTLDGFFDDDLLMGGAGSDLLNLAENSDTLVGGAGKDGFNFKFTDAIRDTIADFDGNPGGDLLDLSTLLSGYTPGVSNPADFIQTVVVGGSTQINIDKNGATGGIAYTLTAATLLGRARPISAGLIANGVISAARRAPPPTAPTIRHGGGRQPRRQRRRRTSPTARRATTTLSGGDGNDTLIGGAGHRQDGWRRRRRYLRRRQRARTSSIDGGRHRAATASCASISIDLTKYSGIEHATLTGKAESEPDRRRQCQSADRQ